MAGPIPLLGLLDELRDFANRRNIGQRMVGGGVRGAATRGLLGMDAPEDATPIQREVYENAVRLSAPAQGLTALKAATVFHGSPHKFTKFDPKKIGTGEGAQAYGHGMYVAESPEVAGQYRKQLAPGFTRTVDDVAFDASNPQHLAASYMQMFGKRGKSPAEIAKILNEGGHKEAAQLVLSGKKLGQMGEQAKGSLYKIDLPDEAIARMLDWDRPFSQQSPEVRAALQNAGIVGKDDWLISGMRGREIYNRATFGAPVKLPLRQQDDQIYASQRLREAGIPGIRYLDQGSRGQGKGTSNFVVFPGEEELLRILERNGVPIQSLLD
jgi:hypothetical protein